MKPMTKSITVPVPTSISGFTKFKDNFINPVIAGFWGFFLILMMIFFIHLFSYATGAIQTIALDMIDFLVASVGFVFQLIISIFRGHLNTAR